MVGVLFVNDYLDWTIDAELAWLDHLGDFEAVLDEKKNLPTPENNTLYQDYYIHLNGAIESWLRTTEAWLRIKSGYDLRDYSDKIVTNRDKSVEWLERFYELPECTSSNS